MTKSHRSPANTHTSISLPRKLLKKARDIARSQRRPFSNYVTMLLEREVRREEANASRSADTSE